MTLIFGHDFYRYDFFRHEFLKRFVLSVTQTFISRACFSRARLWKSKRFFFPSVRCKKEGMLQGVLNGDRGNWGKNRDDFHCMQMSLVMSMRLIRNCKIEWLRTTTTVKHDSTHDQNHVTDHFFLRTLADTVSCWVVSRSRHYGEHFARILPSR